MPFLNIFFILLFHSGTFFIENYYFVSLVNSMHEFKKLLSTKQEN